MASTGNTNGNEKVKIELKEENHKIREQNTTKTTTEKIKGK